MSAKVAIIGAGISGLVAATELEKQGYKPVLFEKSAQIGGRLKTDVVNGIPLDHGFQVLLTAYPAVSKYLSLNELRLRRFLPGANICSNGKMFQIGDITRNYQFLLSTLSAPIGNFSDKVGMARLAVDMKKKSVESIFEEKEQSTLHFLQEYGFSEKIINTFFRPFFGGVFLENELNTSSRKFLFTYKMFAEGFAAIPEKGMQEIPNQLAQKLSKTTMQLATEIVENNKAELVLANGEVHEFDFVVNATNFDLAKPEKATKTTDWHGSESLYFETSSSSFGKPIIALLAGGGDLVNNLHFVSDLLPAAGHKNILCVTILKKHRLGEEELIKQVKEELRSHFSIEAGSLMRHFKIPASLPVLNQNRYKPQPESMWVDDHTVWAGDSSCNASINGAIEAGAAAAQAIMGRN
ncbi:NAD(P)-binding protein [bacterium]|nr:NAD(P)-binding protein [bacterium]